MSGFLTVGDAKRIVEDGAEIVKVIVKLASLGLTADAMVAYARSVVNGEGPPSDLGVGAPKPLTIQAYSMLRDPKQYARQYGISDGEAMNWRSLFETDRARCLAEVETHVNNVLADRGSMKVAKVTDKGAPGSVPSGASPTAGTGGRLKAFKAEIASRSGIYGAYTFVATDTKRVETQAFAVDLGWNCHVMAQSKALAVAVARITRVKGRHDPSVEDFIFYIASNGRAVSASDIPSGVHSLACGPRDHVEPSERFPAKISDAPKQGSPTVVGSKT